MDGCVFEFGSKTRVLLAGKLGYQPKTLFWPLPPSPRLIWLLAYSFLLAAHSPIDAHINCAHMCVCLPFAFACDDLVERAARFLPKV